MSYGIGRVPADVDPAAEALASLEAQQLESEATGRRRVPKPCAWNGNMLNWRPWLTARDGRRRCAACEATIGCLTTVPDEVPPVPCFTNYDDALCEPCGLRLTGERDAAALAYLRSHAAALKAAATAIHLNGNDYQLGSRHWQWLVGHASLRLCLTAQLEPPSWWADFSASDTPLAVLAAELAGALPPVSPRAPERFVCRRCGAEGREGAYPFSTLPGSGLCDDCA